MARRPKPPNTKTARTRAEAKLAPVAVEAPWIGFGELLRRIALGLTAALIVARAYWPSEHAAEVDTGRGLGWVFALLIVAGIAIASKLIGGTTALRWSWTDGAVYALIFLVGISSIRGAERRVAINLAWEWAGIGVAFALTRNLPRGRGEASALAWVLAGTATAVAVYGLYQVAVEFPILQANYLRDPETILRSQGIPPDSPLRRAFQDRLLGSNEPFSTFALANSLACFLLGPIALLLAVGLETLVGPRGRGSRAVALASASIPTIAILVCLLLTKSRSADLGLLVALLVLAWRHRKLVPWRSLLVAGGVLGAVIALIVVVAVRTGHLDRLVITETPKSLRYRLEYWTGAWRVIIEEPGAFWRGVGPGNFAAPYLLHKAPQASEEIRDPHNLVLEVWATAGFWAALTLISALVMALRDLLGPSRPFAGSTDESGEGSASSPTSGEDEGREWSSWIVAAAGLSWPLVVLMGWLDPFLDRTQADLLARWLILGASWGLSIFLFMSIYRRRPIAAEALGIAVLAMVMNLLAAGGIGIPSVALGLWVAIAIGLDLRDDRPCGRVRIAGGRGPAFGLAMLWAALLGSFWGAINPWWQAESAIEDAEIALIRRPEPSFEVARDSYLRAARLDPIALTPWLALADLERRYWYARGAKADDPLWETIATTLEKARKRAPRSIAVPSRMAAIAEEVLSGHGANLPLNRVLELQAQVVAADRIASRLYPSSAFRHARLAESSARLGDREAMKEEAREALRLDALNPHVEKELPEELRRRLRDLLATPAIGSGPPGG